MRIQWLIILILASEIVSGQNNRYLYNDLYSPKLNLVYNKLLIENIGYHSQKVIEIFKKADANNDHKISESELQQYQNWLTQRFRYKENETALCPDDFIAQGGGDCEDFAIMTCCMLNYHGVVAFVAGFGRVTTNKHAVCIMQINEPVPPGYLYYTLENWNVPNGMYTPIDYEKIGGLKAIDRRWKIARINKPVDMYGKYW